MEIIIDKELDSYYSSCIFVDEIFDNYTILKLFGNFLKNFYENIYNITNIFKYTNSDIYFLTAKFKLGKYYSLETIDIKYDIINEFIIYYNRQTKINKIII
jgi:hypothetical protein